MYSPFETMPFPAALRHVSSVTVRIVRAAFAGEILVNNNS